MPLPKIRPAVARSVLARLAEGAEPLAEMVDQISHENPEYLRTVTAFGSRCNVGLPDFLFIASFAYLLLNAQAEVEELEKMVGGEHAPAALK